MDSARYRKNTAISPTGSREWRNSTDRFSSHRRATHCAGDLWSATAHADPLTLFLAERPRCSRLARHHPAFVGPSLGQEGYAISCRQNARRSSEARHQRNPFGTKPHGATLDSSLLVVLPRERY